MNSEFISNHSISSCQIENYFESRFIGSGVTYFDSLGRQYCYDVFDSLGKINYTGHYYYDSSTLKPKKFVGILHSSVGKYEENFSPVYKAGLLQIDSSDKMGGTIYLFYDTLGREIKQVTSFKDSNHVRTVSKGYSQLSNKPIWLKDYMRKNGRDYLDSHRLFYYDKTSNLLKEDELITNNDNSSNTNTGPATYIYDDRGLMSQKVENSFVHQFKYASNGLLSENTSFFKKNNIVDVNKLICVTKYRYTFY